MRAPAHGRRPILSIVLAGGEGKRLMPLTADRAKPAVPFGGKYRLIDFAISNLVNGGFRHIVVLTQYKSHSLDVHISLTWQLSTILGNYVTTVPAQMRRGPYWYTGSADALFQNMNLIDDEQPEHVIVFGADHIYRLDPRQMLNAHIESGAGITVAAIRLPLSEAHQFGAIEKDPASDKILGFHEKDPNAPTIPDSPGEILASMGNYVFEVGVFRDIMDADSEDPESNHDLGGDIIPKLVASGDAHVYDYTRNIVPGDTGSDNHYWRDVGTLDSYFDAHMDLVAPLPAFSLYNHQWPIFTRGLTEPPAKIANGPSGPSEISNCIMSNGVIVAGGRCSDSVLSRDVYVDDEAEVVSSVLMGNVRIGSGARLNRCIIDKNVTVPPGFEIGFDPDADGERFIISEGGVVAVPKGYDLTG
ncbi:MAG: glucose-1-phosphate adenylyltransferase [Actinomycetia bacterium]|nr:glucose-1-phosphate adenylyltransferase [Actinomycetes bacterium]MCP4224351.1 glucose-1-phosphate adenylyltransferase [Actinomycetes bacterium]MCP5033404.1 glucose-1-phosphate adenylyltransferase [Actinomycetes bacterium]